MARDAKSAAVKAHEDRRTELQKQNEETERRMAAGRPTPTQEENDLAKLGELDIDAKQPDGTEPETREVKANENGPGYQTRSDAKKA